MINDAHMILCSAACLPGIGIAGWYFVGWLRRRSADRPTQRAAQSPSAHRPWRALGAAICGLVGVMSFAGVLWIDWRNTPRVFLAFWATILVLLLWLCGLALLDLTRTRQQLRQARAAQRRKLIAFCRDARQRADSTET